MTNNTYHVLPENLDTGRYLSENLGSYSRLYIFHTQRELVTWIALAVIVILGGSRVLLESISAASSCFGDGSYIFP